MVQRRHTLAQSLPGPASSQVGFALGVLRAGWLGGLGWLHTAFGAPDAGLRLRQFIPRWSRRNLAVHGLQLVAVAVVAQAVLTMKRALAPDRLRMTFAIAATGLVLFVPLHLSTLLAIAAGAAAGLVFCRSEREGSSGESIVLPWPKAAAVVAALSFFALLILPPLAATYRSVPEVAIFSAFYRSGALVFGGGHVVLPLLEDAVLRPGWITQPTFLAGYGAAQALPGPLFSIGAYLGASISGASVGVGPKLLLWGFLGLIGIFTPGLLAMAAYCRFGARCAGTSISGQRSRASMRASSSAF